MIRRTPPSKDAYWSMLDAAEDHDQLLLAKRLRAILRRLTWIPKRSQPQTKEHA